MVLAGGAGVISVIGQGFPKDFSNMVRYGLENKVSEANAIHYKIMPVIDHIFSEGNPAGIKAVLHKMELCESIVRLPLVGISDTLLKNIEDFIDGHEA